MSVPLRVRDYMVRDVATVPPDMDVMRVVQILNERDLSGVVVIDAEGKPLGMITERDCIEVVMQSGYFDEHAGPASEYMSTPLETAAPEDSLMDVAQRMVSSPYRRLPVVEEGRLVGLIGRRDVLRVLASGNWFPR